MCQCRNVAVNYAHAQYNLQWSAYCQKDGFSKHRFYNVINCNFSFISEGILLQNCCCALWLFR